MATPPLRPGSVPGGGPGAASPRPDASMDLLRQIAADAVDPDYGRAAAAGRPHHSRPWALVGVLATGALLTAAIALHAHGEPSDQAERAKLARQVVQEQAVIQAKKSQVRSLDRGISTLQAQRLPASATSQLQQAQVAAGATALSGPGVTVTCDDAPRATGIDYLALLGEQHSRQAARPVNYAALITPASCNPVPASGQDRHEQDEQPAQQDNHG